MNEDSTFFLEGSGEFWEADWLRAESTVAADGCAEFRIPVARRPDAPRPAVAPGHRCRRAGTRTVLLKHGSCGCTSFSLAVEAPVWEDVAPDGSRRRIREEMPFREPGKRYTRHFKAQVGRMMAGFGTTLKKCARFCRTTPAIVKGINKERLAALAGDMRPLHPSRYIAVDEFKLAGGHRFCTIVIDAETGELLYLEPGRSSAQLEHFFDWAGEEFVRGVRAVAMDMSAGYALAVAERCPHAAVVYDGFHIVKMYNETVVDRLRVSEQKRLEREAAAAEREGRAEDAELLRAERRLLFGERFNLLANRRTLRAKDARNARLNDEAEARGGERGRREDNDRSRLALLDANDKLQAAVRAREELQDILGMEDPDGMRRALGEWCGEWSKAGIAQLTRFCGTILRRKEGIASRAVHRISSGIVEGTNTLVKNIRRMSFGLCDFDYFGLLVWEQTHRPNQRRPGPGAKRPYHRSSPYNKRVAQRTIYTSKWAARPPAHA